MTPKFGALFLVSIPKKKKEKKKKEVSPKLDKIILRMPNMFSQIQILIRISKFSKENSTSFRLKNFPTKKKKKKTSF